MSETSEEPAQDAPRRKTSWKKRLFFIGALLILPYVILEAVVTSVCWFWLDWPPPHAEQYREAIAEGPICTFDPISGYRISRTPSRWLVVDPDGTVQSWGVFKGNNLGFSDPKDFHPKRGNPAALRLAVFGDSQTATQFIQRSWPTCAEQFAAKQGRRPIELLNFAVDGAGLANWWGIVTKILEPQHFELDGVIFAVCCDDLYRGFYFLNDDFKNGEHFIPFGRAPGMNPSGFPKTLEEAKKYTPFFISLPSLSPQKVDDLIQKKITLPSGPGLPVVATVALMASMFKNFGPQGRVDGPIPFDEDLRKLIQDLRTALIEKMKVRTLVVTVPMPDDQPVRDVGRDVPGDVSAFASLIDARIVNGADAFRDPDHKDVDASYLRYEYHFNQAGAERFGRFVAEQLENWPNVGSAPPAVAPSQPPEQKPAAKKEHAH